MTRFFAGVLSVIAVGVMLIAYGLLNPRADAFSQEKGDPSLRPFAPEVPAALVVDQHARRASLVPVYAYTPQAPAADGAPPFAAAWSAPPSAQAVSSAPSVLAETPRPARASRAAGAAPRSWRRTALVIGGSTATGAGIGAIVGGRKGALIGAAIGGGASTLYESTK